MKHALYHFESDVLKGVEANLDGNVQYTELITYGNTATELFENATIGREDWHGNEVEYIELGELSDKDYKIAEQAIAGYITNLLKNFMGV